MAEDTGTITVDPPRMAETASVLEATTPISPTIEQTQINLNVAPIAQATELVPTINPTASGEDAVPAVPSETTIMPIAPTELSEDPDATRPVQSILLHNGEPPRDVNADFPTTPETAAPSIPDTKELAAPIADLINHLPPADQKSVMAIYNSEEITDQNMDQALNLILAKVENTDKNSEANLQLNRLMGRLVDRQRDLRIAKMRKMGSFLPPAEPVLGSPSEPPQPEATQPTPPFDVVTTRTNYLSNEVNQLQNQLDQLDKSDPKRTDIQAAIDRKNKSLNTLQEVATRDAYKADTVGMQPVAPEQSVTEFDTEEITKLTPALKDDSQPVTETKLEEQIIQLANGTKIPLAEALAKRDALRATATSLKMEEGKIEAQLQYDLLNKALADYDKRHSTAQIAPQAPAITNKPVDSLVTASEDDQTKELPENKSKVNSPDQLVEDASRMLSNVDGLNYSPDQLNGLLKSNDWQEIDKFNMGLMNHFIADSGNNNETLNRLYSLLANRITTLQGNITQTDMSESAAETQIAKYLEDTQVHSDLDLSDTPDLDETVLAEPIEEETQDAPPITPDTTPLQTDITKDDTEPLPGASIKSPTEIDTPVAEPSTEASVEPIQTPVPQEDEPTELVQTVDTNATEPEPTAPESAQSSEPATPRRPVFDSSITQAYARVYDSLSQEDQVILSRAMNRNDPDLDKVTKAINILNTKQTLAQQNVDAHNVPNYQKLITFFNQEQAYLQSQPKEPGLDHLQRNPAITLESLGERFKQIDGNYKSASESLKKAIQLAKEVANKTIEATNNPNPETGADLKAAVDLITQAEQEAAKALNQRDELELLIRRFRESQQTNLTQASI